MAPKKKGGSPKKKAAVLQTPEMLDVRKYQIAASIAEERTETLRVMQGEQISLLTDRTTKLDRAAQETDELYTYLDTQMLTSARERQGYEAQLRQAERRRKEELADLTTRMELQQATASEMIHALRVELKERSDEVEALHEFALKGPERDAEIVQLKDALAHEEQTIQDERSSLHLKEFKLRRDINKEMHARIHQAKANFLDITGTATVSRAVAVHAQHVHVNVCMCMCACACVHVHVCMCMCACACTASPARHAELHRHYTSRRASHTVHHTSWTMHLAPRTVHLAAGS